MQLRIIKCSYCRMVYLAESETGEPRHDLIHCGQCGQDSLTDIGGTSITKTT